MMSLGVSLWLFFLCPAFSLPVPAQLSKEDETVVKCISEILADALSRSSPMPVTSECMKILREDERVLALLQHRHLLTELEELAHQENAKHLLAHEINHNSGEEKQQGELQKSDGLAQQKEAERAGRKKEDEKEEEEEEEEVMKKDEKTKKPQEKIKVSQKEDGQDSLEERDVEEEQEEKEKKERTASETWYSKEYFGHVKKRGSRQPKIRKGMLRGEEEGQEREEVGKRRLRMGEEERDDPSEEEEQKKYHPGGHTEDESWEEEEERSTVAKRVAEKASDEETAQFEEEKLQSSKAHLHKSWKPWKEETEEEEEEEEEHDKTRHGHHHPSVGLELRKRHGKEEVDPKGRHRAPEEEEEEEEKDTRQRKVGLQAQEVEKLEEIERQLKWAADNLEELKRG